MHTTLFIATLLPTLAYTSPLIIERAGGPALKPIPQECFTINPLPHASCGTANVEGWMPSPKFVNESLLYQAYFNSFRSKEDDAKQCRQQCYGYGNIGECKSSFIGYQIPTPPGYYGTDGGVLEAGCLLFSDYMDPKDALVKAPAGQYVNATATNRYCPS